jgi:hypothetical protein
VPSYRNALIGLACLAGTIALVTAGFRSGPQPSSASDHVPDPEVTTSPDSSVVVAEILDAVTDAAEAMVSTSAVLRPSAHIALPAIDECSGIVRFGDEFVVHNDSGDTARLFCSATLDFADAHEFAIPGANAVDWEEITIYEGDLLVCDMGDNRRVRSSVDLYRVRLVPAGDGRRAPELVATYRFTYPDGPHDAEAAFVRNGLLHVVTKDRGDSTRVYRFDQLASTEELGPDGINIPTRIAVLELDSHDQVTGAAYDAVSDTVMLLTYSAVVTYPGDALFGRPAGVRRFWGRRAEGICVSGRDVIVTNEQRDVFVIPGILDGAAPQDLIPETPSLRLPLVSRASAITAVLVPLKGADVGESLRLAIDDQWVLLDARLRVDDDFHPVRVDTPSVGSSFLVMFTEREHHYIDGRDAQFALGVGQDDAVGVWRVDLGSEELGVVRVSAAEVEGQKRGNTFAITARIPLNEVFEDGIIPATFRFDARGMRLRAGPEPHFSGNDVFAIYRPYVWGRVEVER